MVFNASIEIEIQIEKKDFCSTSVKNAVSNLIGIALNL